MLNRANFKLISPILLTFIATLLSATDSLAQTIVARINGRVITADELFNKGGVALLQAEQDAYELKRAVLDRLIADTLTEMHLKGEADIDILLRPPDLPRFSISTDDAPVRGDNNAPVTILEFADFHCPFCRQASSVAQQVIQQYGSKVKFAFRNLPLEDLHPLVRNAHEAAECAREQGRFWEYHDKLFANEPDGSPESLKLWAWELGMDTEQFDTCLDSQKFQDVIQKDLDDAARIGLNFTPVFFINGRILSGAQPFEKFSRMIDEELKNQK